MSILTFRAGVPQSDVSVCAARGQAAAYRGVGHAVEHFTARLRGKREHGSSICPSISSSIHVCVRWIGHLTSVVFSTPVSASHRRMVWSQDALHSSAPSHHSTEDTASLWPDRVMRGVCREGTDGYHNSRASQNNIYLSQFTSLVKSSKCWLKVLVFFHKQPNGSC